MTDFSRIYARQEYLTPGAADTVELIAEAVRLCGALYSRPSFGA